MTPHDTLGFEQIVLTRLKVAAQRELSRYVAERAEVEVIANVMRDSLVFQIRSEVLAQYHDGQHATGSLTVDFSAPATWWQHFKQQHGARWWLRWLVSRRPVRETIHSRTGYASFDIERYRGFPEATIRFPDELGGQVHLLVPKPMRWRLDDEQEPQS